MNIIKKRSYRLAILSDLHCGSQVGICGPEYFGQMISHDVAKHNKFLKIQKAIWNFYSSEIAKLNKEKQIDILVVNGDCIDGKGERSGGTELTTTDLVKQIAMAKNVIDFVNAKHITICAGTDYHTSTKTGEDWEEVLANQLKAKFESHCFLDINKKIFDIKHHLASGGGLVGPYNSVSKEIIWSKLWQEMDNVPKPISYLIRSHIHRYSYLESSSCAGISTPALQGMGSRFGSRRCSGLVDLGFISFDINTDSTVVYRKHIATLKEQKAKATIFE
jgi:hypothetical protein